MTQSFRNRATLFLRARHVAKAVALLVLLVWAVSLAGPAAAGSAARTAAKPAAPPAWAFDLIGFKGVLYPSFLVAISKIWLDIQHNSDELGNRSGLVSVNVVAPRAGAKAIVEMTTTSPLIRSGRAEVTLPRKGKLYHIFPFLSIADAIVLVKKPVTADVTAKLWLDGVPQGERTTQVTIASANDCVRWFVDDGVLYNTDWMFAAYVNEDDPAVDQILREALATGEVAAFTGYKADDDGVRKQVKAIWQALRQRGIRYSHLPTPSVKPDDVWVQNVRLISEALAGRQANCVEGSCLFASVFFKLGLETTLILFPDHMLVGVALDPAGERQLYLETTMIGDSSFEDAVATGEAEVAAVLEKARQAEARQQDGQGDAPDDAGYALFVSVNAARKAGVVPIPDSNAARQHFFQTR
ncbi:MAG: hypothetical protein ACP59X_16325 [Solidesulfovibrio sp. DCME]|uniref:hypothetical protein n=1 Tax=Solidesulfovibrio sp. DCME TaxID=3447380 RepID=UPI003D1113D1